MTIALRRGLAVAFAGLALIGAPVPQARAQGIAGPYLAATQADLDNNYAPAADYYDIALRALPDSPVLLNNALIVNVIAGRLNRAVELADRLDSVEPGSELVGLVRLSDALAAEDFDAAIKVLSDEDTHLNALFSQIVEGWALVGKGDFDGGIAVFDNMTGSPAFDTYGAMNKGLALAFAGDFGSAAEVLDGTEEQGPLHLTRLALVTHIVSLALADRRDEALQILEDRIASGNIDDELVALHDRLKAGEDVVFDQIPDAAAGAAQAFSLLAGALSREDDPRLGLVYARLGMHVRPGDGELDMLVGDVLSRGGQYQLAIESFQRVTPDSPWYVGAEIGRADALAAADRGDEAVEVLSSLARARPSNAGVQVALGDLLRSREDFSRAADAYTAAIDLVDTENQGQWRLYYARGIAYERTDRWTQAEADFRHALELNPEQPLVLNYLGYSLVEKGENLDEAEQMIRTAVEQEPDNGYIIDSLAWVLYTLGRYDEAVEPMERAVELLPVDPILNDHLGDVLWMVGRKLEARFQWKRALSFDPEPDDAERIRRKLEVGLDKVRADEKAQGEGDGARTADGD